MCAHYNLIYQVICRRLHAIRFLVGNCIVLPYTVADKYTVHEGTMYCLYKNLGETQQLYMHACMYVIPTRLFIIPMFFSASGLDISSISPPANYLL